MPQVRAQGLKGVLEEILHGPPLPTGPPGAQLRSVDNWPLAEEGLPRGDEKPGGEAEGAAESSYEEV